MLAIDISSEYFIQNLRKITKNGNNFYLPDAPDQHELEWKLTPRAYISLLWACKKIYGSVPQLIFLGR